VKETLVQAIRAQATVINDPQSQGTVARLIAHLKERRPAASTARSSGHSGVGSDGMGDEDARPNEKKR
jgi:hypothetical protein